MQNAINNAVYDENSGQFPVYVQPDPVQQYVNSYNIEQDDTSDNEGAESTFDGSAVYPNPSQYSGILPYSGYPGFNPGAFAVQTGYEGYLVPSPAPVAVERVSEDDESNPLSSTISSLTSLIPGARQATQMIGRSLVFLLGLVGVTIFGGGMTTAICTFTPLCSISFAGALPFVGLRTTAKKIADSLEINKETIARTVSSLQSAISKYDSKEADTTAETNVKKVAKTKKVPAEEKVKKEEANNVAENENTADSE